jgi:hypothetical protein
MKTIVLTIVTLLVGVVTLAQNEMDVLRYSYITGGGTARYMSMGGAFGALGADMSAASTNPAGLGRYSKSELVFTPGYHLGENRSLYNGTTAYNTKGTINFTNIGYVGTMVNEKPDLSRWKSAQIGIVYNKLHNFNFNTTISGESPSSITHMMANYANGYSQQNNIDYDPFFSGLALLGELIYEDENEAETYYSYVETDVRQTKTIDQSGQLGETAISFSGNYDDMLYIGGTIGIQRLRYKQTSTHHEEILDQTQSIITDLTYTEQMAIEGRGFNIKLGAIYLPTNWLRLGIAYHSATNLNIADVYSTAISSNDTIFDAPLEVESPQGNFNYKIRTPSRTIFSAAGIIGERAIVALDYEAADLTKGTLKADKYGFDMENDLVQNLFQSVRTIRIGAEYKLNDFWVVRGGFAHFSSPIKREFVRTMPSRNSVSLGLGYRTKNFFWDVAFVNTSWAEDIYLYDPNLIDAAKANYNQVQLLSTFGFRF